MRDELLALLEDGPHPTSELASWLRADFGLVAHELRCLQDEGLVRRINRSGERAWVLAAYVVPAPPAMRRLVDRLTPPPCASPAAIAAPPSPERKTYTINGQEYEVVWDGRGGLVGDAAGLGSTLSGDHFAVPRGR